MTTGITETGTITETEMTEDTETDNS